MFPLFYSQNQIEANACEHMGGRPFSGWWFKEVRGMGFFSILQVSLSRGKGI